MADRWPRTGEWPGDDEPTGRGRREPERPRGWDPVRPDGRDPGRPDGRDPGRPGGRDPIGLEARGRDPQEPAAPQDPERVIARFRPHARRLFWPVVAAVLSTAAGGFGIGVFRAQWAWVNLVVAGVVLLLLVVGSVLPLVRWLGDRTVVTTRRLVTTTGLGVRTRHELLHSRGYDVTVRRTGLQGVFRTGDVLVFPGEDRPIVLADVPSADLVVAVLHDLVEAHDQRRRRAGPRWDEIVQGRTEDQF